MRFSFFVADVGNSTVDLAGFSTADGQSNQLLRPAQTAKIPIQQLDASSVDWSQSLEGSTWLIGSVNQPAAKHLEEWLRSRGAEQVRFADRRDFQLATSIRNSDTVGIDRLASATAANQLRASGRPAIIIDSGTATTIDCLSPDGVFWGGMIAPGFPLCFDALAANTNQLPNVRFSNGMPPLVGNDTASAIQAGVFWLTVAGLDGILERLQQQLAAPCDIFATGGSMPRILPQLDRHAVSHQPHLVLSGLATLMK